MDKIAVVWITGSVVDIDKGEAELKGVNVEDVVVCLDRRATSKEIEMLAPIC